MYIHTTRLKHFVVFYLFIIFFQSLILFFLLTAASPKWPYHFYLDHEYHRTDYHGA